MNISPENILFLELLKFGLPSHILLPRFREYHLHRASGLKVRRYTDDFLATHAALSRLLQETTEAPTAERVTTGRTQYSLMKEPTANYTLVLIGKFVQKLARP